MTPFLTVTLLTLISHAASVELSYDDVLSTNFNCTPGDSCTSSKISRLMDPPDWTTRNCFCDNLCAKYGDCCIDARAVGEQRPRQMPCTKLRHFGKVYMVLECPADYQDSYVREHCEDDRSLNIDPIGTMPVTSLNTSMTYRNYYCAICHGDIKGAVFWKPRLECRGVNGENKLDVTQERVIYSDVEKRWGLELDGGFFSCRVDPYPPDEIGSSVRSCQDAFDSCPADWKDEIVIDLCHSYTGHVYHGGDVYRNIHCALCNGAQTDKIQCLDSGLFYRNIFNLEEFDWRAFSVLFDVGSVSGTGVVGTESRCDDGEMYDLFFKKCRTVMCVRSGQTYRDGRCVDSEDILVFPDDNNNFRKKLYTLKNETNNKTSITPREEPEDEDFMDDCGRFALYPREYHLDDDGVVYVPTYDRRFNPGEYVLNDDVLMICVESLGTKTVRKFGYVMGLVSLIGLSLSIIGLLGYLFIFFLDTDMRCKLSGKNLASLSTSLLLAYTCFIFGQFLKIDTLACTGIAILIFYFFLVSFFWMKVMAFDTFYSMYLGNTKLQAPKKRHMKKFVLYSIYCWLVPLLIVALATTFDVVDVQGYPAEYRPQFGVNLCWFSQRNALLIYFVCPVAAIMGTNVILFIITAKIVSSHFGNFNQKSMGEQKDWLVQYKAYIRLTIIMGLAWSLGLVAAFIDIRGFHYFWYGFVLFNTMQGFFIFVFFGLQGKVCTKCRSSEEQENTSFSAGSNATAKSSLSGQNLSSSDICVTPQKT